MDYEVKDVTYGQVKENGDGTATQESVVMSGVVGDTYGFNRWDNMTTIFAMTLTADQIKAQILTEAAALVVSLYPNT